MAITSISLKLSFIILIICCLFVGNSSAQFRDDFDGSSIMLDPSAYNGWSFYTGDGTATMDFRQGNSCASILVDAANDRRNIWWALIRRQVSSQLDLVLLTNPDYELRVEARVKVSHAPRRINLNLNTQRTTDFHSHLMEYDIADTSNWHIISMTTHGFDVLPGDTVYAQLALMDWGLEKYQVDIDYYKVDVVDIRTTGPDMGNPIPYHPPVADPEAFAYNLTVAHDAVIDLQYPDMNFNKWCAKDKAGPVWLLSVNESQYVIMRWDLSAFAGKKVIDSGLLELTTYSLQRSPDYMKDFGMVRVVEILGGDPDWGQENVTCNTLCQGQSLNRVLNTQMIIDIDIAPERGDKNYITLSNPVLQRMIDGKTLGLAVRPLGAVNAAFYAIEYQDGRLGAKLHINVGSN